MRDHLRAAIQVHSGTVPETRAYSHIGWRIVDGAPHYLHGAGAIGRDAGKLSGSVVLPRSCVRAASHPPDSDALSEALKAELRLLELGPDTIMIPLLAAAFRAALGRADFSLFLAGETGVFKSETAALIQQHYGPGFNRINLPTNWWSTANSAALLQFLAKDAILVIDDFATNRQSA